MANELPDTIKCGDSATGYAQTTSSPSATHKWTHSSGYGGAVDRCKADLATRDAKYQNEIVDKVNNWMDTVNCVESTHCKECKKHKPNILYATDVEFEDIHHETGSNIKSGTVYLERLYWVQSGFVDCSCPGQTIIHTEEDHRAIAERRKKLRKAYIRDRKADMEHRRSSEE